MIMRAKGEIIGNGNAKNFQEPLGANYRPLIRLHRLSYLVQRILPRRHLNLELPGELAAVEAAVVGTLRRSGVRGGRDRQDFGGFLLR